MLLRFTTCVILLALYIFIQHTEGFQRILVIRELHPYDNSFSDDIHDTRATVDGNGSGIFNTFCCMYGNCSCSSLHNALVNLTNNVLINITTNVALSSVIPMVGLVNITITGHNNPTVYCNSYGGLYLMSCKNCIIEGITWKGCGGGKNINDFHPVLKLHNSSNTAVRNCTFQNSTGQALVLSGVSGNVNIDHCNFLYNKHYRGHGTAIHFLPNIFHFNLTITDCEFSYNGDAKSIIYFGPQIANNLQTSNYYLRESSFHFNKGVPIYLFNHELHIDGNTEFYHNTAENGGAFYISDNSKVIFHKSPVAKFAYNKANNGGAIYLTKHSTIWFKGYPTLPYNNTSFDGTIFKEMFIFYQNRAIKNGKDIYADHHSHVMFGNNVTVAFSDDRGYIDSNAVAALHVDHHSNVTFAGCSEVKFKSTEISFDVVALYVGGQSEVIFKGNTKVNFNNFNGFRGSGAMYIYFSVAIFKEHCKVLFNSNRKKKALCIHHSSVMFEEDSMLKFNNNKAYNGGVVYITDNSTVIFKGNSLSVFNNNEASNNGGAVYIKDYSNITLNGNATVQFNNNEAYAEGGALYSTGNSAITFDGNSTATFIGNNPGAMYITGYNTVTCKGNSTVIFKNNNHAYRGGAIFIAGYSIVKFEGSFTIEFNSNNANYGGVMFITQTPTIIFKEYSKVTFNNNEVSNDGGAIYIADYSQATVTFKGNSMVSFNNNEAYNDGGAVYISHYANSFITFAGDSKVAFNNNSATNGGAVYSFCSCTKTKHILRFTGSSTITFNGDNANNKGGALCVDSIDPNPIEGCYPIEFDNLSTVTFINNTAFNGGAIYVGYNINIKSQDNSSLLFRDNLANIGGAIYSYKSNITLQGNSRGMFDNNVALQDGGMLFCYTHCNISFIENTAMIFIHNKAAQGGVMHIWFSSIVKFQGNCMITFAENKAAEYGGVIYVGMRLLCRHNFEHNR